MGNMSIIITRKLSCQNLSLLFTDGKTNISVSYLPLRASVLLSRRFKTDKRKLSLQIVGIELERNGHLPEKNDGIGCIMGFVVYCTVFLYARTSQNPCCLHCDNFSLSFSSF